MATLTRIPRPAVVRMWRAVITRVFINTEGPGCLNVTPEPDFKKVYHSILGLRVVTGMRSIFARNAMTVDQALFFMAVSMDYWARQRD